eukprot:TRINITY_DN7918_c0_g1_i6.p1 TRINITY_DN7918_c0_g1~~TRINITY_DN7918_c0_g1_i6.p1  ORF type:complete len:376 (-),score=87.03 TRINITY_DN7918_c0_g1_i6:171-1298(-)
MKLDEEVETNDIGNIDKIAEAILTIPRDVEKKFSSLDKIKKSSNSLGGNRIKEVNELYPEVNAKESELQRENQANDKEFDIAKYALDSDSDQADNYNDEYSEPSFRENETEDLLAELQRALRTEDAKVKIEPSMQPTEEAAESYNTPHFTPDDQQANDIQAAKQFDTAKTEPAPNSKLIESNIDFNSASSSNLKPGLVDFMTIRQPNICAEIDYQISSSFKEESESSRVKDSEDIVRGMSFKDLDGREELKEPIEELHKYIVEATSDDKVQQTGGKSNCYIESLNNDVSERAIKCMLMESLSTKNRAEKTFFIESMNEIHNSERVAENKLVHISNAKVHRTNETNSAIKKYLKNILYDPIKPGKDNQTETTSTQI